MGGHPPKIPRNAILRYNIQLTCIEDTPHHALPVKQQIQKAEKQKGLGNAAFQRGDLQYALTKYNRALALIMGEGKKELKFKLLVWNNISQVYLKKKEYDLCL